MFQICFKYVSNMFPFKSTISLRLYNNLVLHYKYERYCF